MLACATRAAGARCAARAAPPATTTRRAARVVAAAGASSSSSTGAGASEPSSSPAQSLGRRAVLGGGVLGAAAAAGAGGAQAEEERRGEVVHSEQEWRELLPSDSYRVLREAGTERPFSSPLNDEKRKGTFVCAGCGSPLFPSDTKYNSGTGWPSFYKPVKGAVDESLDLSIFFMPRTEVRCHKCQGHLGHVFDDGPAPTGQRYCMNGAAMRFEPAADA